MSVTRNAPPRPLVAELSSILFEASGLENATLQTIFEESGRHPELAVEVRDIARRRLAHDLPVHWLTESSSVEQLAQRVENRARDLYRRRRGASVAVGVEDGSEVPVFAFAGAGAGPISFAWLAEALVPSRGVYAMVQHGQFGRGRPSWTVAGHARRHLRAIRRIQPQGPYVLLGHSFGGRVAAEVAKLIEASGDHVQTLILLDTVVANPTGGSVADVTVGEKTPPPLLERVRTHLRILLAGIVRYDVATQHHVFWELGIRAQNRHALRGLSTATTVVVSDEHSAQEELWRVLAPTIRRERVGGNHHSVLSSPQSLRVVVDLINGSRGAVQD